MKKIYTLMVALLFSAGAFAQHNVTFRVDMTGQTISANGVHVAGDFQMAAGASSNWDPAATSLTNSTGNIYEIQVNIPSGIYQFKFINDNTWGGVESVPGPAQVQLGTGNDNRWIAIDGDTVLAAVEFGGAAPSGMKALTLAVDMSLEASIDDTVSVAGSFQGWTPGATQMYDVNGDSIYLHTTYLSAGSTPEWKFINGTDWGVAENVPSGCAMNGNRHATVNNDTVYGVVCFGLCASCFIPDTFDITIAVDMNAACGTDSVDIAGPFNGWGGGDYLTDPDMDGVYEITIRAAEPEFKYKARYILNGSPSWEGGADKIINFSNDTIVPVRCFGADAYGPCPPIPSPSDITFIVDMRDTVPASEIYMIADFTQPSWQDGATQMSAIPGKPGFFSATVSNVCPGTIQYKFVNGDVTVTANEENYAGAADTSCLVPSGVGGFNRIHMRSSAMPDTLSFKWNRCAESGIGIEENFSKVKFEIYPNPFSGATTVDLGAENEVFDVSLVDLSGRVVFEMEDASGKLRIHRGTMESGVYMLKIRNENGETNINKVIVQ